MPIRLFLFFYFSLHLFVAFAGIRYWPLTDYPMFGHTFPKKDIHTYFWMYENKNGVKSKAFDSDFGRGEIILYNMVTDNRFDELGPTIEDLAKNSPKDTQYILLIDKVAKRMDEGGFSISENIILRKEIH